MGERKGTNKYYPPDFNPKIHKNLNAYHGTHALRERGRRADEGIITIRFEMPYNCWCLTCKNPIGMGVRYNAQKTKVGMYHSTPIYKFSMPCHLCAGKIVMQTDPQNFDYIILEGARRKLQRWDAEENEQIVMADYSERKQLALNAMYHLEHDVKDKNKATDFAPVIYQLECDREGYKDDFTLNQVARKRFRETKQQILEKDSKDNALLNRLSLCGSSVQLLPESDEDSSSAKILRLSQLKRNSKSSDIDKLTSLPIDEQAIFHRVKNNEKICTEKVNGHITPASDSSNVSSVGGSENNNATAVALSRRKTFLLGNRGTAFDPNKMSFKSPSNVAHLLTTGVCRVTLARSEKSRSPSSESLLVSYVDSDLEDEHIDDDNDNGDSTKK